MSSIFRVTKCDNCQMNVVIRADTKDPIRCPKCVPAVYDKVPQPVPSIAEAMRAAGFSPQEDTYVVPAVLTWTALSEAFARNGFPPKWVTEFMRPLIDSGQSPERFRGFPEEMGMLLRTGGIVIADGEICVTATGRAYLGDGVVVHEPPDTYPEPTYDRDTAPDGDGDEPWRAA